MLSQREVTMAEELTVAQVDALRRIRWEGPEAWCKWRGRAGGAVSRMFRRMAEAGLVTNAPYRLTPFGRRVLSARLRSTGRRLGVPGHSTIPLKQLNDAIRDAHR